MAFRPSNNLTDTQSIPLNKFDFKRQAKAYRRYVICPICFRHDNNIEINWITRDKDFYDLKQIVGLEALCKNCLVGIKTEYILPPNKPPDDK